MESKTRCTCFVCSSNTEFNHLDIDHVLNALNSTQYNRDEKNDIMNTWYLLSQHNTANNTSDKNSAFKAD
jgi:hypothetical protein